MKEFEINELKAEASRNGLSNALNIEVVDNNYVYNIMRTLYIVDVDFIEKSYFKYYRVNNNETWNSISYNIYGTNRLYWLILKLNGIKDPTFDPAPGSKLKYISEQDALEVIESIRGN